MLLLEQALEAMLGIQKIAGGYPYAAGLWFKMNAKKTDFRN
jgi:hypothetical protein